MDAIKSYEEALQLYPLYSDCYFNLGNIYLDEDFIASQQGVVGLDRAEIYHKKALLTLEQSNSMEEVPTSIITKCRVCNMIGEINKRKEDYQQVVTYLVKGIESEPIGYRDNY